MDNVNAMENIQVVPKKKGRGGARINSGRPKGSTNKITAASILAEIAKLDVPFEVGLAQDYIRARQSGDTQLVQRYQQMFINKVIADKTETDITSNGESIMTSFVFPTVELNDWKQ